MNNLSSNYFFIFFFFTSLTWSQSFSEKIIFTSSNPYSFSEIISNSEVQKQDVFGQLVVITISQYSDKYMRMSQTQFIVYLQKHQ